MAVHASRHIYPPMTGYGAPQSHTPASMHAAQHDLSRGMYNQGFAFPQHFFPQQQYPLPTQGHHYGSHTSPQPYPAVTSSHSNILLSQQHVGTTNHGISVSPRTKLEQVNLHRPSSNMGMGHGSSGPLSNSPPNMSSGNASNPSAAPGPIPATTPLVVRQDGNGVQWIAFEYSRDRVKMEYTIRCDVESVSIDELSPDFKTANCVYPRAIGGKQGYKGNRLHYETECNAVGWALAELNPVLREKRGLIQRAVDSWRNSNQDPRLRSRRVRRQAKMSNRKAQGSQTASQLSGHPGMGPQGPGSMSAMHAAQQIGLPTGQLHHHHSNSDGLTCGNEDVSASNELKTSYLNHARLSSQPLSPTDTRQQHAQYSDHPTNTGSSNSVIPDGADSSSSNLTRSSSWVKEEDEEKRLALFGDVVEGKKRKFILVDDHVRGTRVRVRVLLDTVKMEEIPDSHLRTNSVYPRSYYPRQIHSPPGSPGHPGNWDDCESEDEDVEKGSPERRKSLVQELLVDGSEVSLPVPRMSRSRRQKELALNELGYRMSWSQAKTFNERSLFMQKSLDAYRDKMRTSMLASGQEGATSVVPHFETRIGKRKWLERRSKCRRGSSSHSALT